MFQQFLFSWQIYPTFSVITSKNFSPSTPSRNENTARRLREKSTRPRRPLKRFVSSCLIFVNVLVLFCERERWHWKCRPGNWRNPSDHQKLSLHYALKELKGRRSIAHNYAHAQRSQGLLDSWNPIYPFLLLLYGIAYITYSTVQGLGLYLVYKMSK